MSIQMPTRGHCLRILDESRTDMPTTARILLQEYGEGRLLTRAEWEAAGIYYWVCRADGEDFTSEGQATEWGVIGCHSYRPGMCDPDEYDHDHDRCGWVVVAAVKGDNDE